ncbi:MAG: hypothetical protein V3R33_03650, partial [Anaerolineales bacterium]
PILRSIPIEALVEQDYRFLYGLVSELRRHTVLRMVVLKEGFTLAQHGGRDSGEYGYMDSQKDLETVIELLEHYPK